MSRNRPAFLLLALPLACCSLVHAQTPVPEPVRALAPAPVPPTTPPVSYETATLPKDRAQAWQMVLEANDLTSDTLAPWYLLAHYKTYDERGLSKGEGTLEYLWRDRDSWYVSDKTGTKVWARWRTAKGLYAPPDQPATPGYPESLLLDAFRQPLSHPSAPQQAPPFLAEEHFPSFDLSCFRTQPLVSGNTHSIQGSLFRFCFAEHRPILRLSESTYSGYFNKTVSFQHHIVAKQINYLDGRDPVFDFFVDELRNPRADQLAPLEPPPSALLIKDTTLLLPPEVLVDHILKKGAPSYPAAMKAARIQGTVRLAVIIDVDGHVTITDVLHSPAPELTDSAKKTVSQWIYAPYLKDGAPVAVHTTISITYVLGG